VAGSFFGFLTKQVQGIQLVNTQFSPPTISPLFGPTTPLSALFSNTLGLHSSRNVKDEVSHPWQTTGKITVFWRQTRQKVLDRKVANITRIQSDLNFLLNRISICYSHSQKCELGHKLKGYVCYLYVKSLPRILMTRHVASSLPLLGNGVQRRTFRFLCSRTVPGLRYRLPTATAQNN
jgi:hypothetical protein